MYNSCVLQKSLKIPKC